VCSLRIAASSSGSAFDFDEPFAELCTIGKNQLKFYGLIDTGATGGNFVDKQTAQLICEREGIEALPLSQPKAVKGYNGQPGPSITHAIFPRLCVKDHTEDLCPFLITQLGNRPLILGKAWMKKHGAVLDLSTESLMFYKDFCDHKGAPKTSTAQTKKQSLPEAPNLPVLVTAVIKDPNLLAGPEETKCRLIPTLQKLKEGDYKDYHKKHQNRVSENNIKTPWPPRTSLETAQSNSQAYVIKDKGETSIHMIGATPFRMLARQKRA
jgi:hypothetical protein